MIIFVRVGGQREGYWGHILLKTPKIALISEYLAADSSPDVLDCFRMFWNVKTCSNCVNTFFYMHNCDKVCVPKGDPKHMPKHVPNWAELIIDNSA